MSMMMTKMKSFGESILQKSVTDAEFNNYKSRLEASVASLKLLREQLPAAELAWKEMTMANKHFLENYVDAYPDEDVMRRFGRETDRACEKLHRALMFTNDGKHWDCDRVVGDFIAEVESLDYKAVIAAQNEVAKYNRKLDVLRRAKSFDEERFARNEEKMDVVRSNYERVLQPTVARMRELWAKVPVAFTAIFIGYWACHVRAVALVGFAFNDTKKFVALHEDMLAGIGTDIRSISKVALEEALKQLDTVPTSQGDFVKVLSGSGLVTSKKSMGAKNISVDDAEIKHLPTSPVGADENDGLGTVEATT